MPKYPGYSNKEQPRDIQNSYDPFGSSPGIGRKFRLPNFGCELAYNRDKDRVNKLFAQPKISNLEVPRIQNSPHVLTII